MAWPTSLAIGGLATALLSLTVGMQIPIGYAWADILSQDFQALNIMASTVNRNLKGDKQLNEAANEHARADQTSSRQLDDLPDGCERMVSIIIRLPPGRAPMRCIS